MDTWIHKLYQDCAADLFRIARYRLQDEQLAQDIVQEVFLLLLERKKELKRHPNQKGWLIKAMDYRILHALEKQGRELPLLEVYPSPDGDHSQSLDALLPTQLSPEETQLLKLFYEEHLSYQELSEVLGIPPATCGTRLHRARLKCKRYLTQEKGGKLE